MKPLYADFFNNSENTQWESDLRDELDQLNCKRLEFEKQLQRIGQLFQNSNRLMRLLAKSKFDELKSLRMDIQSELDHIRQETVRVRKKLKELRLSHPRVLGKDDFVSLFNVGPEGFESLRNEFRFFGFNSRYSCRVSLTVDYLNYILNSNDLINNLIGYLSDYRKKVLDRVYSNLKNGNWHNNQEDYYLSMSQQNFEDFYHSINVFLKNEILIFDDSTHAEDVGIILKENLLVSLKQFLEQNHYRCIAQLTHSPVYGAHYDIMVMRQISQTRIEQELLGRNLSFILNEFEDAGSCTFHQLCFYNPTDNGIYLNTGFYTPSDSGDPGGLLLNDNRLIGMYGNFPSDDLCKWIKEDLLTHELSHFLFESEFSTPGSLTRAAYSEVFARIIELLYSKIPYYSLATYDDMVMVNPVYQKSYNIIERYFDRNVEGFVNFDTLITDQTDLSGILPKIILEFANDPQNPLQQDHPCIQYLKNMAPETGGV